MWSNLQVSGPKVNPGRVLPVHDRFTDNGDLTMTDNVTGLIWSKDGGTPTVGSCTGGVMTWDNAFNYVSCLNTNNYLGFNDWRVPNKDELISLVTNGGAAPFNAWLNGLEFSNIQSGYYWSSTELPWAKHVAYIVKMEDGAMYTLWKISPSMCIVWPVRGGHAGTFGNLLVMKPLTGSGTVTSSPPGISCGIDCEDNYSGINVELSGVADSGSFFDGWYGQGYGSGNTSPANVTMTSNRIFDFYFKLCAEWPVMADKRYESITTWYSANSTFASPVTLQFMGGSTLGWDASIDQEGKVITLAGGYDCNFGGSRTAGASVINGPVLITHATFVFDEITMK